MNLIEQAIWWHENNSMYVYLWYQSGFPKAASWKINASTIRNAPTQSLGHIQNSKTPPMQIPVVVNAPDSKDSNTTNSSISQNLKNKAWKSE
jgi:hypothetical protein